MVGTYRELTLFQWVWSSVVAYGQVHLGHEFRSECPFPTACAKSVSSLNYGRITHVGCIQSHAINSVMSTMKSAVHIQGV